MRFGAMLNLWSLSVRRRENDPPDHFLTLLHLEFTRSDHRNGILPHQTAHPAPLTVCKQTVVGQRVPDPHTQLVQFFRHPGPAIAAKTGPMLVADVRQQHHVTPLPVRYRAMFPCPQATIRDPHHKARTRLRKEAMIVVKKGKLHGFWAAKNWFDHCP
jgi:hypothetical protein